jgi:hypothetical protein
MPIQAEAPSSSRKQASSKQYIDKAHKDTKSSENNAEGHEQRSSRRTVRTQSEDSYEGETDETSSKRASPSPTRLHEESYQVYRKAFHKMQDEQDFEAAATLATLSKRSKLHHLEPSSYSLDPVSSSLQAVGGAGDEDGRKHRLPHKMRFKNMGDGPQEGEQQQPQPQPS